MCSAVLNDALRASLTAPNGKSQEVLSKRVKSEHRADGLTIALEAHSTGSPLGDPIEIGAARAVWNSSPIAAVRCSSLKASLGHLEFASGGAGIAALIALTRRGHVGPSSGLQ